VIDARLAYRPLELNVRDILADRLALILGLMGEESEWFAKKIDELTGIVAGMPRPYGTESIDAADKVVPLHYFCDSHAATSCFHRRATD
jgi:hypothetical protein